MDKKSATIIGVGSVALALGVWIAFKRRTVASPATRSANGGLPTLVRTNTSLPLATKPQEAQAGSSKDIALVYVTGSGTAEMFGKVMAAEARAKGFSVNLVDAHTLSGPPLDALASCDRASAPAALDRLLLGCRTIVLLAATHGEGDAPESGAALLAALESVSKRGGGALTEAGGQSPGTTFSHAVFALGDTSYKFFCRAGKRFDKSLCQLGSAALLPCTTGDARGELESAFDDWREALWPHLEKATGTQAAEGAGTEAPQPELAFVYRDDIDAAASPFPPKPSVLEPTQRTPYLATVLSAKQLVAAEHVASGKGRRTVELMLCVKDAALTYQAGDHLGIMARNSDSSVRRCLAALGVDETDAGRVIELTSQCRINKRASPANTLPMRVALRTALAWYVDLSGPPRRSTVRMLARYATNEGEQQTLFHALEDKTSFADFTLRHRTVVDVLEVFASTRRIGAGHLLEVLPKIAPRFFSIASDSLTHPASVRVCVVETAGGLLSPLLTAASAGDQFFVFIRHAAFNLPMARKQAPIIMVGAGTGVAPYVGFLERRAVWAKRGVALGPAYLYFGCRQEAVDFLFEAELQQALAPISSTKHGTDAAPLTALRTAFSRDGAGKVYVQHRIAEDAAVILDLLQRERAVLYICGDASRMAGDVEETLIRDVFMGTEGMSRKAAEQAIAALEKANRILKDVWTA